MAKYNGHKNWNHWNVSLWLSNDAMLYGQLEFLARTNTRDVAARKMLERLPAKTPDGAPYTKTAVLAAMRGIK